MAKEYKMGRLYRIGGKLFMKEHVCLFRIEGEYKIYSFTHSPLEDYRRERATTEEELMWHAILVGGKK